MTTIFNLIYRWHRMLPVQLLLIGGTLSNQLFAQDTSGRNSAMEPVVVTATRTETPVSETTRSVTVISNKDIQQQAAFARNLSDVLAKTVPGLGPSTEALSSFGQTLRGRDYLVLIDGIPQSTALRTSSRDLNTIDVDAIERIEVVRGGTAAYGFGAAGGLINIITKHASKKLREGFSKGGIRFSTQHFDDSIMWETTHRISGTRDNMDYLVSGTYGERGQFFDASGDRIAPDPIGVQGGLADTNTFNILGKLGFNFDNDRQRVQFTVNHFNIRQDTNYTFGLGDPANGIKTPAVRGQFNPFNPGTKNTLVGVDYINKNFFGSHVSLKGYYGDQIARFAKFPGFAQTEVRAEKFGSRLTINTPITIKNYEFSAIWGLDYLRDQVVQAGLDGPTVVPFMRQDALAGFLELELPISDYAILRGGVRQEAISVDISNVINRGGNSVSGDEVDYDNTLFNGSAVVFITDYLELYGGYSQSFSIADIGRAIRDANAAISSAGQLASEAAKVDNFELGLRGRYGPVQASVVGFYSDSNNGTTFNKDLSIIKLPERIWGVEGELSYQVNEQVNVGGTASWAEGEMDLDNDGKFDEDLPNTRISPVKLSGFLEYSPLSWWQNRMQALYIGDRTPNSTQFGGLPVDDYVIVDLTSSIAVGPGHFTVAVKNLLNENYFPLVSQASGTPYGFATGPGRIVGFTYAFNW
ncbi:iron complex outermembrane recepter protein [Nitrosomonas aestuarii]|uniref:Iron complex outermembrane recepter protein n=1 Tax=Nitrosomonas aestuarii TaxID=52441 RepID=A0A1I3ZGH9_9PROT|nr:TonB-dependent receptor [Nitrosomonas aestuarii]SFK42821.1 iron complex outermembrane recepter protein [Nitrosomonas aestuarii]